MTSDIYPTVLELTGVKVDHQPPLDGVSLVPLLEGKAKDRPKPIGFWDYPIAGISTPAKKWMEELYAAQIQGQEPNDPSRIVPDAGKIKQKVPIDQFPGHSAWLDGSWKLHRIEDRKTGKVMWELYDLAFDPKESRNLYEKESERSAAMSNALEAWLQSVARSLNGEDYKSE